MYKMLLLLCAMRHSKSSHAECGTQHSQCRCCRAPVLLCADKFAADRQSCSPAIVGVILTDLDGQVREHLQDTQAQQWQVQRTAA
jgi:hypothetical protein